MLLQVQNTSDSAVLLTPPPINTTIPYTTAGGRSGSAEFVTDSSYQLTNTTQNDVYTFTVIVTNAAGTTSQVSAVTGEYWVSIGLQNFNMQSVLQH